MIELNNLTTISIDEEFFKKNTEKILEEENKKELDLSIALVGQGRIRELNKKYKRKNRVTDVLAFPESKVLMEKFRVGPTKKIRGLGEIVICLSEVKKNAKRFSLTFEKELARVLIHGILHLLGYDHEKSKEGEREMEKKENYYLEKVFK